MRSLDLLFWGRYGNYGPDYPRNRVVESALRALGHRVRRFVPRFSPLADLEYRLSNGAVPDLIWVPCFRHRDLHAAWRYAKRQGIPLVFDPLISAYDKRVNERQKFTANSRQGQRLLAWERKLFALADVVIADTDGHRDYFSSLLNVPVARIRVVPVGAEEDLFQFYPLPEKRADEPLEVVFSGTFIELHGIELVIEAVALYSGPPVRWRFLGEGPLKADCEARVAALRKRNAQLDITFENWRPLQELPARLAQADILLGIFGTSEKALRVIPNKVYQALALGRPVVTARSAAYPAALKENQQHGFFWCEPGSAQSIADAVSHISAQRNLLNDFGEKSRATYDRFFSEKFIQSSLDGLLSDLSE